MGDIENSQREAGAVFAAAAPFVVTLVGIRREELLDQIGVRAVDFHAVKTGFNRTTHAFTEFGDHAVDFSCDQCRLRGCTVTWGRQCAWRKRLLATNQFWLAHAATVITLLKGF